MRKVDEKYFKNPENYIPKGSYCYDEKGKCPFWDKDETKPDQENGYCHFLKMGDWEMNEKGAVIVHVESGEKEEVDYFPMGLLWDQVKECETNDEYEEE